MTAYEKEQLKTTTIHIPSRDIYKTKNIDGLIKYKLKEQVEGLCGEHGYIIKDSVSLVKRSIGKITTQNGESKIEYDLTYKMKVLFPNKNDKYECIIDSVTKMGIIAYLNSDNESMNNIKDSPILVIIPNEYLENDISTFEKDQKIDIIVLDNRIKYRSTQIQVIGKIL